MRPNIKTASLVCMGAALAVALGCSKKTTETSTTTSEGATSTAPSGQQAANQNAALVRFVNAVPGQGADLWFGDTRAFTGVSYKTATPYKELANERHDFTLTAAGAAAPDKSAVKNNEGLTKGAHYTVVAMMDKKGKETLNVINDDLSNPAIGKAKVRVINASGVEVDVLGPNTIANAGTADRTGSADRSRHPSSAVKEEAKWFAGVNPDSSTSYKEMDPANGAIAVERAGHRVARKATAQAAPVDIAAGKLYTLVVTGQRNGALDVLKIEDELNNATAAQPAR